MGRYFGTDGIRGKAHETLSDITVKHVGEFLGNYYKGQKILLGMDTRVSSKEFEEILTCAIKKAGGHVYSLGYCSTPCLAFLTMKEKFACGIMISASHNPYSDNGIKVFGNDGFKINDQVEGLIEDYIDNPVGIDFDDSGSINDYSKEIKLYQKWLLETYPLDMKGMKIAVDLANGSNCYCAKEVLSNINLDVTYLYDEPDGYNINNNCGSTHLESLMEFVKSGNYVLGLAFDGDADRVLFVDEDGKLFDGDKIMFLLARYLKEHHLLSNNSLVTTVMSNIGLFKAIEKYDIGADITAVGDKNVINSMVLNNYVIGGEQSGHIIYSGDCNFGDGLKTALFVFKALSYFGKTLKAIGDEVIIYPQLLKNVRVKDKTVVLNDEDINNLISEISNNLGSDGRILVRPSGTEPLIRVMVEAKNDELCEHYVSKVVDAINNKGYQE